MNAVLGVVGRILVIAVKAYVVNEVMNLVVDAVTERAKNEIKKEPTNPKK